MRVVRAVHGTLWSSVHANPWRAVAAQFAAHERAQLLVRVFYAAGLFLAVESVSDWPALLNAEDAIPPWPSAWIPAGRVPTFVPWILGGYLVAAALAAALPTWRVARGIYFVLLVQYISLTSGFGGTSHSHHMWLWVSALLVLLPDRGWAGPSTVADRHYFLSTIWVCQLTVMFFYSLTGFWKIVFGLHGVVSERGSAFAVEGFSRIVAQRDLFFNDDAVLGEFFRQNHAVGWAVFLGTIYIEFACLAVAFRPRLHRTWGILLVAFHVGTELAMGFTFPASVLVVALLLVCSPFAPHTASIREAVLDLPGVFAGRRFGQRRRWRAPRTVGHRRNPSPAGTPGYAPPSAELDEPPLATH